MNVLLIGGAGSLINNLIIKLNKEGERVYLLTGSKYSKEPYQKVFERYDFTYDCNCIKDIYESVAPDLTIYMGAFDTNFRWSGEEAESVKYSASLVNILMGFAMTGKGKFVYLSSGEIYGANYDNDIGEDTPASPVDFKAMSFAQGEELCESYRNNRNLDIITLRLDHLYKIPKTLRDVTDVCTRMCLECMAKNTITVDRNRSFSLLYEADAIEFIYRAASCMTHRSQVYNISSSVEITMSDLASMVQDAMGDTAPIVMTGDDNKHRVVLSNNRFDSEFGNPFFCDTRTIVQKIAAHMKKYPYIFLTGEDVKEPFFRRIIKKSGWLLSSLIPFLENLIAFIPFFMLNNRAVGSQYFANLDFYLLYVLLFAIVYGQQQATFSAVLAVAGYCFRQMYDRSGFEVMLDANTYIWIAQLFILGLVVGYMRDQIKRMKFESEEERDFLFTQLDDIQDINGSNVRVKNALETQIVNQNDSVGKIYKITSALDKYNPEEVLFYAADMLGKLVKSKDVAIYTISNETYARLLSSTSKKARVLGNSIKYTEMGEMYETMLERKVFINRKMDERYPLMANAIYSDNDEMQMIMMIWGIPWESMTLGQANQLIVISALIQNAVLRATRYLDILEHERYVEGARMLTTDAFKTLMQAFMNAQSKGLTECTLLRVDAGEKDYKDVSNQLMDKLRQTDYMGTLEDGNLYTLLANSNDNDAQFVIKRFGDMGYNCCIVKDVEA